MGFRSEPCGWVLTFRCLTQAGRTAVFFAIQKANSESLRVLLKAGASTERRYGLDAVVCFIAMMMTLFGFRSPLTFRGVLSDVPHHTPSTCCDEGLSYLRAIVDSSWR